MRKMDLLMNLEAVRLPDSGGGRRPFPHAVHREHDRLVERRRKESARRMTQMLFAEQQLLIPSVMSVELAQLLGQQVLQVELFSQPQGYRQAKRPEPARREHQVGLE